VVGEVVELLEPLLHDSKRIVGLTYSQRELTYVDSLLAHERVLSVAAV
jgi:hypothetical protein